MGNSTDKNDMEQIQRGLEAFLEKEMDSAKASEERRRRNGQDSGYTREPEELDVIGQLSEREQARGRRQPEEEEFYQRSRPAGRASYVDGWDTGGKDPDQDDWDSDDWDADDSYGNRQAKGGVPCRERRTERTFRQPVRNYYDEEPPQKRRTSGEEEPPPRRKADSRAAGQSRQEASRMSKKPQKRAKKTRRKKHRFLKFLIGAAIISALLGAGLYQLVGAVYGKMNYREIASVSALPMKDNGVVNILLIGNDSRQNSEDGRSDAMILLSISNKTKTIYMTSLLRDMYVRIPGHDDNRLNAAYSFGGAELLMETIKENFGIPVNRYMLVNFGAFVNLVDAVGGIDLELTTKEMEYVNGYLVEYNILTGREQGTDDMEIREDGLVHLNGPQALAYSRNRLIGTDFGRTERQRKILTAVIKKAPSALLTNAGGLIDGLMPNLTTNLTRNECFQLGLMGGKLITYDIVSDNIPQPDTFRNVTIRKMAVLEVDFDANTRYLKEKIYGE